jgi:hypothetical protein
MGTTVPPGMVTVVISARRLKTTAADVPIIVTHNAAVKRPANTHFIFNMHNPPFIYGIGTPGGSTIMKETRPPGQMSLLVNSFSVWECHM